MKNRIAELKSAYGKATSKSALEAVEKEMNALADKDNEAFSKAMVELAQETADRARELVVREHLKDAVQIVSMAYIAKTYFRKSRGWLNQRVNGASVNGRPAKFTPEEIDTLNHAFQDISRKLSSINVPS